ncbi:cysteine hydrolase family protein [Phyllobacterium zundukense]|uniref:Cysteine hydrolase n=1 Tax=Phyllobacterium zundukense TaxID=1867719 RepID=A0ACD4CVS9_9HYPH|nr:cysteine hydrolase family protein [Phyllobacterium zundukense]UXN57697.1 cysteine hydrolase [Phyllobacterium zundukense]
MSPLSLLPEQTALIVIDVQKAFDEMEAVDNRRNNPEAVARIAELLAAFRRSKASIIHIRHSNQKPQSRFNPAQSGHQVIEEARERPDEPVLVKTVNSSFIGTDLEQRLRNSGIHGVVIVGATTNHCVETTTRMAGNLGFDTLLVSDATWTFDRQGLDGRLYAAADIHAMSLANLNDEFCRVVATEDIIAALKSSDFSHQR